MTDEPKFKYIGESNFFVNNGDILSGHLTQWSVKRHNSNERDIVKVLYVKGAGFKGEQMPINSIYLQQL